MWRCWAEQVSIPFWTATRTFGLQSFVVSNRLLVSVPDHSTLDHLIACLVEGVSTLPPPLPFSPPPFLPPFTTLSPLLVLPSTPPPSLLHLSGVCTGEGAPDYAALYMNRSIKPLPFPEPFIPAYKVDPQTGWVCGQVTYWSLLCVKESHSLVPRPLSDFILQMWRKTDFSLQL